MTKPSLRRGRAAKHASRTFIRSSVFVAVALMGYAGFSASATPGMAADSGDFSRFDSPLSQSLYESLAIVPTGPEVLLAEDVSQLIDAELTGSSVAANAVQPQPRNTILQRALSLIGTPYRWGGNTPDAGFDCSGLVKFVFGAALGLDLPRVSREMANSGQRVDREQLNAGDLVFFGRNGRRIDHVGIYIGEGRFVHAPRTGRDVSVSSMDAGYWAQRFQVARRVLEHN